MRKNARLLRINVIFVDRLARMKNVINFPKKPISTRCEVRKQHIAGAVAEPDFWDEAGDTMYKTNAHMLSTSRGQEKHIIQFNITFE